MKSIFFLLPAMAVAIPFASYDAEPSLGTVVKRQVPNSLPGYRTEPQPAPPADAYCVDQIGCSYGKTEKESKPKPKPKPKPKHKQTSTPMKMRSSVPPTMVKASKPTKVAERDVKPKPKPTQTSTPMKMQSSVPPTTVKANKPTNAAAKIIRPLDPKLAAILDIAERDVPAVPTAPMPEITAAPIL